MPIPEKTLIAQFRSMAKTAINKNVLVGIGDDCAVLHLDSLRERSSARKGGGSRREIDTLVTTDFSLENVHFKLNSHSPESVGHRCLARGLSDIAAMGGDPVAAFLSLALPRDIPHGWASRFMGGLIKLAKKYRVALAGGDTAQSPNGMLADIVVVGTVPAGEAVLRSGARPGDRIYVSGSLGGSTAAVYEMQKRARLNPEEYPRHFFPEPRVKLGRFLRDKRLVSAMIDTSDGLSTDLTHICEESGVGAELEVESIPRSRVGRLLREVDLKTALHGGEDYELLFTSPPDRRIPTRIQGVQITQIGEIKRGSKIMLLDADGVRHLLRPQGWEHFRH